MTKGSVGKRNSGSKGSKNNTLKNNTLVKNTAGNNGFTKYNPEMNSSATSMKGFPRTLYILASFTFFGSLAFWSALRKVDKDEAGNSPMR